MQCLLAKILEIWGKTDYSFKQLIKHFRTIINLTIFYQFFYTFVLTDSFNIFYLFQQSVQQCKVTKHFYLSDFGTQSHNFECFISEK